MPNPVVLVVSEEEFPGARAIWGTGGWLQPEAREALDWLALCRLLGWGVDLRRPDPASLEGAISDATRWVLIGCDANELAEDGVVLLRTELERGPILVVARAAPRETALARLAGVAREAGEVEGRQGRWSGPGHERRWRFRNALEGTRVSLAEDVAVWATVEGAPVVVARRVGRGTVATLAVHPSRARDADGAATALLKHLLVFGAEPPVAWLDLERTLVLRMDDPGGAQNVHWRRWSYRKLGEPEWAAVRAELKRREARLSIGYVSGWVDDGDGERGFLLVGGRAPKRAPGAVYPTPLVTYEDRVGLGPASIHDYGAEYRGIQALRAQGRGDVELHGFTHMHPDHVAWARAPDRYEAEHWYRELGRAASSTLLARPPEQHPLVLARAAFERDFGVVPTTLISPGDEWTNDALEVALRLGLRLVSSYYLALRDAGRFCWSTHVCAPYLDEAGPAWFDAELPVVGYFHDREPAVEGVEWLTRCLDEWQAAGARRFIDFRELAAAVGRRVDAHERDGMVRVAVDCQDGPELVRPLPIRIRIPEGSGRSTVSVAFDGNSERVYVDPRDGVARAFVRPPAGIDAERARAGTTRCAR